MPPAEDRPSKAVSVERKLEVDWLYPKKLGVLKYGRCQDDPSDEIKIWVVKEKSKITNKWNRDEILGQMSVGQMKQHRFASIWHSTVC